MLTPEIRENLAELAITEQTSYDCLLDKILELYELGYTGLTADIYDTLDGYRIVLYNNCGEVRHEAQEEKSLSTV